MVFIVGLEEGVFPHKKVLFEMDDAELEEERRLCYVGMTRAEERLYLTAARSRRLYGTTLAKGFSRFLFEVPDEYKTVDDRGGEERRWGGSSYDSYGRRGRYGGGGYGRGGYGGRRGW